MKPTYTSQRNELVNYLRLSENISDERVLEAISKVPRHLFVPKEERDNSYENIALPIGHGQTISQPSLLAYILEKLELSSYETILEIGAGSGYLAALLSHLVQAVYAIEIVEDLANKARTLLERLNYTNVYIRCGNGSPGWSEVGPFDVIILSARVLSIPPELFTQLKKEKGQLIAPVGEDNDTDLKLYTLQKGKLRAEDLLKVRFVPLIV